jgi:hypothetical protein
MACAGSLWHSMGAKRGSSDMSGNGRTKTKRGLPSCALALVLATATCSDSGDEMHAGAREYAPKIDPEKFSTTIDNRYLFYEPGAVRRYLQTEGGIVEEAVTSKTKVIMGVKTVVVHDFSKSADGELLEDTYDYYAQDISGNVWYFGEDTKAYSGKKVSTEGSWLAGEDGAKPGIVMQASPQIGDSYRQEYLPGEAEDEATVVGLSETVEVPYGSFDNCVKTKEHSALAPGDLENKYYCPQIGLVRSHDIGTIDAGKSEDLISVDGSEAACGTNPAGYEPKTTPEDFSTTIDNEYLAMVPGTVLIYAQSSGDIVEQDVTSDIKTIMGVPTVVVHDFLTSTSGELLEDTYDYFAQDKAGNIWYFGEDTVAFSGADVSTEGSWKAGLSCAKPGIVMMAKPKVGDSYRQEYRAGEAEDEADVVSLNETVEVPYGTFTNCIETKEHTALASGDLENKYYCPNVGLVRSADIGTIDAGKTEDLVSIDGKMAP